MYREIEKDDIVGLYLKEIARTPLLTPEEEKDLMTKIYKGRKAKKRIANGRKLEKDKRQELETQVQEGKEAGDQMLEANRRLVVSIAKKYIGRGIPFLDLIQEGNLGLMKTNEKIDPRKGCKYSTYATWWIMQTITRAIAEKGTTIRTPVHAFDNIGKIYQVKNQLAQELGRSPTIPEITERMEARWEGWEGKEEKVSHLLRTSCLPLSLQEPVNNREGEEGGVLGDFIEDEEAPVLSDLISQSQMRERIEEVLITLSLREEKILRLRFGLHGGKALTLEEIGQKFGLTRERIRQIEGKALKRLRHPRRARRLRGFLESQ